MLLFMIILGFLNLSGMFYYTYAGIKCRTNSILSMAFHIVQKKSFLLLTEKLPMPPADNFGTFVDMKVEAVCVCVLTASIRESFNL